MTFRGTTRSMRRIKIAGFALAISAALVGAGYNYDAVQQEKVNEAKAQSIAYERQLQETQAAMTEYDARIQDLQIENDTLRRTVEELRREVSRGNARAFTVEVTAYDLSEASCNKGASHPSYGITASGMSLEGHTWESARAIAVDPSVIPLGAQVRIKFDDPEWQYLDGVYTAVDTGGAINGNRIDLFMGEGAHAEAMAFGRRTAKVVIL